MGIRQRRCSPAIFDVRERETWKMFISSNVEACGHPRLQRYPITPCGLSNPHTGCNPALLNLQVHWQSKKLCFRFTYLISEHLMLLPRGHYGFTGGRKMESFSFTQRLNRWTSIGLPLSKTCRYLEVCFVLLQCLSRAPMRRDFSTRF